MSSFTIIRGTSKQLNIDLVDQDGSAVDLTGATITLQMAADLNTLTADLSGSWTMTVLGSATNGNVRYDFVPSDTQNLDSGTYDAEVKATYAGGTVWKSNPPFHINLTDPVEAP